MDVEDPELHAKFNEELDRALIDVQKERPWREPSEIENDEMDGIVKYAFVTNDGTDESLVELVHCKCLFGKQLPKMPKEYIVRLVFDRRHFTLVMKKKERVESVAPVASPTESVESKPESKRLFGKRIASPVKPASPALEAECRDSVVAAVCFRPFGKFAEIAFLAVSSKEQVRGYGTRLMNHLKEALKVHGVTDLVTYADNAAVGYFAKQGFYSPGAAAPRESSSPWHACVGNDYEGFIKDYDGANKMVCCIYSQVNYLTLSTMREEVQAALWLAQLRSEPEKFQKHKGLSRMPDRVYEIPGLEFLTPPKSPPLRSAKQERQLSPENRQRPVPSRLQVATSVEAMVSDVIETALSNGSSWPFKKPVEVELAPDYYQVVLSPMDLATMREKNAKGLYRCLSELGDDFKLMFENCLFYNGEDSVYATAAQVLGKAVSLRIERLEQMAHGSRR